MGYMRHHAIVVTGYSEADVKAAHKKAESLFDWVSPISPEAINGYKSFFVSPDGSKEGWEESDQGDVNRDKFIQWLREQEYEDRSSPLDWVEVQYGDDEHETKAVRDSDENIRKYYESEEVATQ